MSPKEKFEEPKVELVTFEAQDIIVTSSTDCPIDDCLMICVNHCKNVECTPNAK